MRRPLESNYRGTDYDFVTATSQRDAHGNASIAYRLDTKRARTEVRASAMQGPLLRELVLSASNEQNTDAQIGRTLFQLLIPPEMEPFMGGTVSMVLEVDSGSAGIPWELLDSPAGTRGGADSRPWAIRSKLLRKLRTDDFRAQVVDADAEAHVLVIGEPKCDLTRYPRLPAARDEARAVAQAFIEPSPLRQDGGRVLPPDKVKALIADDAGGADARAIMNAVLEREWRIVHIAGHGEAPEKIGPVPVNAGDPPQTDGDPRGVVLSNGTFLGPTRDRQHARRAGAGVRQLLPSRRAQRRSVARDQNAATYDRAQLCGRRRRIADQDRRPMRDRRRMGGGRRAAKDLRDDVLRSLLSGRRFIDASAEARLAAYALGRRTRGRRTSATAIRTGRSDGRLVTRNCQRAATRRRRSRSPTSARNSVAWHRCSISCWHSTRWRRAADMIASTLTISAGRSATCRINSARGGAIAARSPRHSARLGRGG